MVPGAQEELPQVFGVMHSSVAQHDENSAWTWVRQNADAIRGEDGPKIQIICGEVRCHTPRPLHWWLVALVRPRLLQGRLATSFS